MIDLPVDAHNRIGPYTDVYDHEMVIGISPPDDEAFEVMICTDCGYTAGDIRRFLHVECERESNRITQTIRELVGEEAIEAAIRD